MGTRADHLWRGLPPVASPMEDDEIEQYTPSLPPSDGKRVQNFLPPRFYVYDASPLRLRPKIGGTIYEEQEIKPKPKPKYRYTAADWREEPYTPPEPLAPPEKLPDEFVCSWCDNDNSWANHDACVRGACTCWCTELLG